MEERDGGLDTILDAGIDNVIIVSESLFIDLAATKRKDSRPRYREGVDRNTQSRYPCNI